VPREIFLVALVITGWDQGCQGPQKATIFGRRTLLGRLKVLCGLKNLLQNFQLNSMKGPECFKKCFFFIKKQIFNEKAI
jgi:hypothetical protein